MAENLVIVESPAKAKTINKYLGRDYKVVASMGHVRDLPKNKLGVDVDAEFAPEYVVIPARAKVIKELRDAAKGVTDIFIATDPDREGEAIGWHLAEELGGKRKVHRLMFNEITKKAILEAIKPLRFLGNDLIVFHLLDPQEISFDYKDASSFEDLESREQIPVVPDSFREQYRQLIKEHINSLTTKFSEQRIDYAVINTSEPLDRAMFSYLSSRERLVRVR